MNVCSGTGPPGESRTGAAKWQCVCACVIVVVVVVMVAIVVILGALVVGGLLNCGRESNLIGHSGIALAVSF